MEQGNLFTAIVWGLLPAVVLLLIVWALDRYEKEPVRLLGIALAFGALAAPLLAFIVQTALDVPTSMAAQTIVPESRLSVAGPLIGDIALGLAVLAVFSLVRHEVDDVLDGLIYGGVVGIGFGMAANFVSILASSSPLGQSTTPGLFAAMVSGLNWVFYAGVIGLAIGLVRRGPTGQVIGAAAVGTAVTFVFHIVHDYLPWWVAPDAAGAASSTFAAFLADIPNVLGLVAVGAISVWAAGRQAAVVEYELREEVERGTVMHDEYATVTNSVRRFVTLAKTLFTRGDDQWRLLRRLYALEVELAFRKHHRRTARVQTRRWLDEDHYRQRIAEARAELTQLRETAA